MCVRDDKEEKARSLRCYLGSFVVLIGFFCCAGFLAMLIGALLLCLLGSFIVPMRLFCCANGVYLQCPSLHLDYVVSVLWGSEYNPASAWRECLSATYCITLHHTATRCNTLQHTATHCKILSLYIPRMPHGASSRPQLNKHT